MAIWLPYKAAPHERKNRVKQGNVTHICRICGKPIHGGGDMCGTCEKSIRTKQERERQGIV